MEIRQVYYALEIAKQKSFSKAARNLYITQPAITHQIKALEEELQVQLFERTPQGVNLTLEGEKFCRYGEKIIEAVDDLRSAFDLGEPDETPLLRIGVFPFYNTSPLQHILTSFFAGNYKVFGNLKTIDNYQAFERLESGDLDFAVVKSRQENIPDNLQYITLTKENLYLLISRKSDCIQGGTIPVQELGKFPLLTGEKDSHFYREMKDMYSKYDVPFNISFMNTKETQIMLEMIKDDVGVILATEQVARNLESDKIAALRIEPNQTFHTILAYPKSRKLKGIYLTFKNYVSDRYASANQKTQKLETTARTKDWEESENETE